MHVKSLQSSLTLCDPMDCSPLGSSVHGILQARILEWVIISSSRRSSWPRDWTHVSRLLHLQVGSLPLAPPGKPIHKQVSLRSGGKLLQKQKGKRRKEIIRRCQCCDVSYHPVEKKGKVILDNHVAGGWSSWAGEARDECGNLACGRVVNGLVSATKELRLFQLGKESLTVSKETVSKETRP